MLTFDVPTERRSKGRTSREIESANKELEEDHGFALAVIAVSILYAIGGFAGTLLIGGWSSRYNLSLGVALATVSGALGAVTRRSGVPDAMKEGTRSRQLPVTVWSTAFIWSLIVDLYFLANYPKVTIAWWQLFFLLFLGALIGMLIVTTEGALDFIICGILGLILDPLADGLEKLGPLGSLPAIYIPLAVALLANKIWPRGPQGVLGDGFMQTGILATFWTILGTFDTPSTIHYNTYLWAIFVAFVIFRYIISRAPFPQWRKAMHFLGFSILILSITSFYKPFG
jgi:hypothetical protein